MTVWRYIASGNNAVIRLTEYIAYNAVNEDLNGIRIAVGIHLFTAVADQSHGFEHIADDLPVQVRTGGFEQTQHMLNGDLFVAGIFPVFLRPAGFELGNLAFT